MTMRVLMSLYDITRHFMGTKETVYPRRETAVCICPSSGGRRFVYINCFCTKIVRGDRGFEGSPLMK
jgi:hypothetical protein